MFRYTQICRLRELALFVVSLLGIILSPIQSSAEELSAELKWRNGDTLKGSILGSDGKLLQWNAEPFAEPLSLNLDQLTGVRFSTVASGTTSETSPPFRLLLNNGDRLEGFLESISRTAIVFRATPFSELITIQREHIGRLVHVGSNYLRYSGPKDLDDWTSSGRDRKVSEWFTDLTGSFATHQWSGNLFREIEFPDSVEIRFEASFPMGFPNLEIGLVRGTDIGPMLETWDNSLVLTYRSRFVPVMELDEDTRKLDFRLFWNQTSGDVVLCDPSGRRLASLDNATVDRRKSDSTKSRNTDPLVRGFSILNRTPELKLLSLSVQEWDGSRPPVINLAKPRILIAGLEPKFETGAVTYNSGDDTVRVGSQSFPLQQFQELILTADSGLPETADATPTTTLAWHDGSNVSGSLESLNGNEMRISTAWSSRPLTLSLEKAKEIRFPGSRLSPIDGTDKLEGDGFSLLGAARPLAKRNGQNLVGWLPPGGEEAVPFADGVKATITRFPHSSANPELANLMGQARLYLSNNEILVGSLLSITPEEIKFTSRITGPITISTTDLLAVDLGSSGRSLEGFNDAEWEEIEEEETDVELTRDSAIIRSGGFGNPSLVLGDRIHFSAQWKQTYGAITLRLFTNGSDENSPSTDLIIAAQGNRLFVGKLKESGAFSFSGDQIPIVGDTAGFEIRLLGEKVEVVVNGKTSLDIEVDPERVSGNGIYFQMGGGWQGWNQSDNEITISDFRIERTPGSLPRRIIDPLAREMSLHLPRSRRAPVPTHLLIAPNGDLLRGGLVSASAEGVRFNAGETMVELPADRISAIVWLQGPPEEEKEIGRTEELDSSSEVVTDSPFLVTHQFVLMDGSRLTLNADKLENERFVGESSLLGTCTIAIENIREMKRGPGTPLNELGTAPSEAFSGWVLKPTPNPVIPGSEDEVISPLIGKTAPTVELTMLDESIFKLSDHLGKVVVLDFWATWCGPCIKAIPDVRKVVEAFPEGTVELCAVNQSESLPIITRFLNSRKWTGLPVALDFDMKVSKTYQVEGIPHSVVIGKDGKVAFVHSGYSEALKQDLFKAIAQELKK
ncbi:MAG: TlpA disulfide reductase family protein [Verrucomicrobiales bacterium]|nr:TlpA disulfide reductase family protein [Verrucomicrobiales bacterium]